MRRPHGTSWLIAWLTALAAHPIAAQTRVAELGRCALELGGIIEDCRLAYRTFGALNQERSNAVLLPTWFSGSAEGWIRLLGADGMVDTTTVFAVVVESLGSGRSSSPRTSAMHPGHDFPEITVGDMVETSYRLLREELELPGLRAVVGISLGGMQAFEWAVRHPDYVERWVSAVGTPRLAIYDRAYWELLARTAAEGTRSSIHPDSLATAFARFSILAVSSPLAANRRSWQDYDRYLQGIAEQYGGADPFEWAWQARAMLRHDVARHHGADLSAAAAAWEGPALIIVAAHDHSISPEPAQAFAAASGAWLLTLDSPLGHGAVFGDREVQAAIREFVSR